MFFVTDYIYSCMGRKKLNRTKDELDKQNRIRRMRYYLKHRDIEKQKALQRYYSKKTGDLQDNKFD